VNARERHVVSTMMNGYCKTCSQTLLVYSANLLADWRRLELTMFDIGEALKEQDPEWQMPKAYIRLVKDIADLEKEIQKELR
jgi:hypothetical protein